MPLVGLAEDVGADDEVQLGIEVLRLEVLDELERPARYEVRLPREVLLGTAHPRAGAERRGGKLAHRDSMVVGGERLAERMAVGRYEPHLVDAGLEDVERDQLMRDVRRVEAAAEQADSSGALPHAQS
jgi:hypothetical protein